MDEHISTTSSATESSAIDCAVLQPLDSSTLNCWVFVQQLCSVTTTWQLDTELLSVCAAVVQCYNHFITLAMSLVTVQANECSASDHTLLQSSLYSTYSDHVSHMVQQYKAGK